MNARKSRESGVFRLISLIVKKFLPHPDEEEE